MSLCLFRGSWFAVRKLIQGSQLYKIINEGYGEKREKRTLVSWLPRDRCYVIRIVGSAGRLFPDQLGFQYCQRGQNYGLSTVKPLGDLLYTWGGFLDRRQQRRYLYPL